jgi:N-acetylmuramoyl-L-alanine amidase
VITLIERASPNHGARPGGGAIDTLVIHYTGMPTAAGALDHLCNQASQVSAHYLIDEDGAIYRLVDEDRRAWHAGVAAWRGITDINATSIGIELTNPGHEFGYRDFPAPQMAALIALAVDINTRHPIDARNVVGHSDIAPARKIDPGERFDWPRLAAAGIGLWPVVASPGGATDIDLAIALATIGYARALAPTEVLIAAFQRHYRPARIDGIGDAETVGLAITLAKTVADSDPSA